MYLIRERAAVLTQHTLRDSEVMGSNPAGSGAFSLFFSILYVVLPLAGPLRKYNTNDFALKYKFGCAA